MVAWQRSEVTRLRIDFRKAITTRNLLSCLNINSKWQFSRIVLKAALNTHNRLKLIWQVLPESSPCCQMAKIQPKCRSWLLMWIRKSSPPNTTINLKSPFSNQSQISQWSLPRVGRQMKMTKMIMMVTKRILSLVMQKSIKRKIKKKQKKKLKCPKQTRS